MRFRLPLHVLSSAITANAGCIPQRTPIEVLKCIRIDLDGDKLRLTTSTGNESLEQVVEATIDSPGTGTCLPFDRIQQVVSVWTECLDKDAEIDVYIDDSQGTLTVSGGRSTFTFQCRDVRDFRVVDRHDSKLAWSIDCGTLMRAVTRTVFATDPDSSRYTLGSISIKAGPDGSVFAATDSRRLAVETEADVKSGSEGDQAMLLPASSVKPLTSLLRGYANDAPVEWSFGGPVCTFSTPTSRLTVKLGDGRFPEWRKIVPQHDNRFVVNTASFTTLVNQACVAMRAPRVTFGVKKGVLSITGEESKDTTDNDLFSAKSELSIDYDGPKGSFTVNGTFLKDVLRRLSDQANIQFSFGGDEEPLVLNTVSGGFMYLLMGLSKE